MDYSDWNEPDDRHCRAWRMVRLDGGGFMNESCMREHGHQGEHMALPLALPSVGFTTTLPGVFTYTT